MSERLQPPHKDIENTARHRLGRKVRRAGTQMLFFAYLLSTDSGREGIRKYGFKDALFSLEARTGLLENSILSNTLYYPNDEEASLSSDQAVAGRWVAYDFDRPLEFGGKFKGEAWQKKEGKLWCFPLEEILDNNPDQHTPTSLPDWLEWNHLRQLSTPSIEELINWGLMIESTYREAYATVGLLEKYRTIMILDRVLDEKVYVITPKGNGLIGLSADSGKPQKNPEKGKVLRPKLSFEQ